MITVNSFIRSHFYSFLPLPPWSASASKRSCCALQTRHRAPFFLHKLFWQQIIIICFVTFFSRCFAYKTFQQHMRPFLGWDGSFPLTIVWHDIYKAQNPWFTWWEYELLLLKEESIHGLNAVKHRRIFKIHYSAKGNNFDCKSIMSFTRCFSSNYQEFFIFSMCWLWIVYFSKKKIGTKIKLIWAEKSHDLLIILQCHCYRKSKKNSFSPFHISNKCLRIC